MAKILGIDLGTTNSVAAIGEALTGKGFYILPLCPGVSVICDRLGRRFTPSVVAEDHAGNFVVGDAAKARAGMTPAPIMFSKRWMGENHPFQLKRKGVLQPEDAAAEVLRYLKNLAETQTGETITEAVITVPAYFDLLAKQKTAEAGEKAGLTIKQLCLEPVAAALMYCASESRPDLRILIYDLGGGTFDVAIIERRDGVIAGDSIVSFDGNRFLGGYNFDIKLAEWMADQLCARGYDLKLDLDDPADAIIHAKLLVIAEQTKIRLSGKDENGNPVRAVHVLDQATGIVDHKSEPVIIDLDIGRDQFEEMIRADIEETIRIVKQAMTKNADAGKRFRLDQIDEIIMVGGSSRIPLVAQRLKEEFGREPRLVEPDLCVGIGAAMVAGAAPTFGHIRLTDLPTQTDKPNFNLVGKVEPGPDLDSVEGCRIALSKEDGSLERTKLSGADGGFALVQIPLTPNAVNRFKLSGTSKSGGSIGTCSFELRQTVGGGIAVAACKLQTPPDVLVKPIQVMMRDGAHELAPTGTKLPCDISVTATRADSSSIIRIPILEEMTDLGSILMEKVPDTLPIGSEIQITLNIGSSKQAFKVRAAAFVPALGRNAEVVVEISKPVPRTVDELRGDQEMLIERERETIAALTPAERFGKAAQIGELQRLMAEVKGLLEARNPDCVRIQHAINEADLLIRDLGAGWKPSPPRADFEAKSDETGQLIQKLYRQKPETRDDGYDRQLADLRKEADSAFASQNQAVWERCFRKVVELADRVEGILDEGGSKAAPPPPGLVLIQLSQLLAAIQEMARESGTLKGREQAFKDAAESLKRIKADDPEFWIKIREWYMTQLEPLKAGGAMTGDQKGLLEWIGR